MGAYISIYLDNRFKKADNVYPVKLRVTYNRERLYIGIPRERINSILNNSQLEKYLYKGIGNYSIDQATFNEVMEIASPEEKVKGKKPKKFRSGTPQKELQTIFRSIESNAQKQADLLEPFTLDGFKNLMSKTRSKNNKVFVQFDEMIDELKESDRIGTAISYKCAATSLKKFTGDKEVQFEYFTKEKLDKYKTWMQTGDNSNSDTTIGMYLRALRTLFNHAKDNGITTHYPFGKNEYKIPKGKGRKIALGKTELQKIFDYRLTEKHPYSFYLDMWKLMYLLGGINPTDMCNLKESNIQNGFVYYFRQKTKRTANEQKEIRVPYTDTVKTILDKWKVPQVKDSFLLPIVTNEMSATVKKAKIAQFVKMINASMKAIGDKLEINQKITSYVARHSISTQLLRAGASVKFIGDQLGHHDTKTTEAYLDGFEDEQIRATFLQVTIF